MNPIIKVIAEQVDEINIAKMIYNITLTMNEDYDIQFDYEKKIIPYVKEIKNITENFLKKEELLKICKKYKLKKYSHLNESELYSKIYNFLIMKKNNKLDENMLILKTKVIEKMKKYISEYPNGYTDEIKIKKMFHIVKMLKYLSNYKFFIIVNSQFNLTVINKIHEFKYDFEVIKETHKELYEDFIKYSKIIKDISIY